VITNNRIQQASISVPVTHNTRPGMPSSCRRWNLRSIQFLKSSWIRCWTILGRTSIV